MSGGRWPLRMPGRWLVPLFLLIFALLTLALRYNHQMRALDQEVSSQEVRRLRPATAASFIGLLTAAYGVGQILGPLGAGFLAARTGSYLLPSLAAAATLLLAACIVVAGGLLSIKSR